MQDFPIILHSMQGSELKMPTEEIVRYACMGQITLTDEDRKILYSGAESAAEDMIKNISCRGVYRCFTVSEIDEKTADLGFATVKSKNLLAHIQGCSHIVLVAITLGVGADRLISRKSEMSAGAGLLYSSAASAAAEAYIDVLNEELIDKFYDKGFYLTERFSAGYGDFSISYQTDILTALNTPKNIGLTISEGYLMIPTKSITAVIGLRAKG